jgi:tRNA pseudouridine13 synthase
LYEIKEEMGKSGVWRARKICALSYHSITIMSVIIHEREQDDGDVERYTKRAKVDDGVSSVVSTEPTSPQVLPPSHSLLGLPLPVIKDGQPLNFHEPDVGISEYIGRGDAKIEGIIKQRLV